MLTTLIWLLSSSPHDVELRELLLKHREELAEDQLEHIVEMWFDHSDGRIFGGKEWLGGQDLLPIVRLAVQPPHANAEALACLLRAAPHEAWPLIQEDSRAHVSFQSRAEPPRRGQ